MMFPKNLFFGVLTPDTSERNIGWGNVFTSQGRCKMASKLPEAQREARSSFSLMASEGTNPDDISDLWPYRTR